MHPTERALVPRFSSTSAAPLSRGEQLTSHLDGQAGQKSMQPPPLACIIVFRVRLSVCKPSVVK